MGLLIWPTQQNKGMTRTETICLKDQKILPQHPKMLSERREVISKAKDALHLAEREASRLSDNLGYEDAT